MLEISSDSEQIMAEASGHMIIHDQPELVVDIIRALLAELPSEQAYDDHKN